MVKTRYMMNTAGRLIGGIIFAALAYVTMYYYIETGGTVRGGIPKTAPNWAAGCFFLAGYRDLGGNADLNGKSPAITGIRSAMWGLMMCSVVFALLLMGRSFSQGQYRDPYKAVFDWIRSIVDLFVQALTSPVILIGLLIGGALCGMIIAKVNHRWR